MPGITSVTSQWWVTTSLRTVFGFNNLLCGNNHLHNFLPVSILDHLIWETAPEVGAKRSQIMNKEEV